MIKIEKTEKGYTTALEGRMKDLLLEVAIALKDVLKNVSEEQRGNALHGILQVSLDMLQEEEKEGEDSGFTATVSDVDANILLDAIKDITGGGQNE